VRKSKREEAKIMKKGRKWKEWGITEERKRKYKSGRNAKQK
jgi:hypothetical protein